MSSIAALLGKSECEVISQLVLFPADDPDEMQQQMRNRQSSVLTSRYDVIGDGKTRAETHPQITPRGHRSMGMAHDDTYFSRSTETTTMVVGVQERSTPLRASAGGAVSTRLTHQLRASNQQVHRIAVHPAVVDVQRQRSMSTERVVHRTAMQPTTSSSTVGSCATQPSSSNGHVWQKKTKPSVSVGGYTQQQRTLYRVALNYFNKKPERGMQLLMSYGFVENDAAAVASFLVQRRGLSKQMIGEYLGTYIHPSTSSTAHTFYVTVLQRFASQFDLCGVEVDEALRRFLAAFRPPGEAQKIERIMQAFAKRYVECNSADPLNLVNSLHNADTVYVLAFAIIMLNTDLHNSNVKCRMSFESFVKNLRGIDDGHDIDPTILEGIYNRIKGDQFRPGHDHVTQVVKVDASILGKTKPILAAPHRRLVCYCRLVEVVDAHKKQGANQHVRDVFLFNDLIVVTKATNKKRASPTYTYRESYPLLGLVTQQFKTDHYEHGIKLSFPLVGKTLLLNAKNDKDRVDFTRDLADSSMEADQMEKLRIDVEVGKLSMVRTAPSMNSTTVGTFGGDDTLLDASDDLTNTTITEEPTSSTMRMSQRALSSSMLDTDFVRVPIAGAVNGVHHPQQQQALRRASVNSFDSGMSSTASVESNKAKRLMEAAEA